MQCYKHSHSHKLNDQKSSKMQSPVLANIHHPQPVCGYARYLIFAPYACALRSLCRATRSNVHITIAPCIADQGYIPPKKNRKVVKQIKEDILEKKWKSYVAQERRKSSNKGYGVVCVREIRYRRCVGSVVRIACRRNNGCRVGSPSPGPAYSLT
jgi:hypothetical protein